MFATLCQILRRIRNPTAQHRPGYSGTDCHPPSFYMSPLRVSLGLIVCSVGGSAEACRHTAPTYNESYKDLLHKVHAQGICSQGLMTNRLIARYVCAQPIQHNRVPHEEHFFYALCPVCVSAGLKTDDHGPKAKRSQHAFIHQRHIKLKLVLICEYVIGIRSVQCWVGQYKPASC